MRWDHLFADLEAQADALERSERTAEIDERTRIEVGALGLLDRLRAAQGTDVRAQCRGGLAVTGVLRRVGVDWLLVHSLDGRETLLALQAVTVVAGLGRRSMAPGSVSVVESRLTLRSALRGIARDRSVAQVHLCDATVLTATIDRVGKDFVELAMHTGEFRRRNDVRDVQLLSLPALAAVRRDL